MRIKVFYTVGLTCAFLLGGGAHASAEKYPKEPVRIVSPFSAGGTNDFLARISAHVLASGLGGQFVVEQRTGAAGMIGSHAVAKSAPNGGTLLMGSISTHAIAPAVFAKLPFNPRKDFTPITIVASVPLVLVVNKDSPYETLDQLLEASRKYPGALTYGSPGSGAIPHLASELLASIAGIELVHVPYRGESTALTELRGGRIDMVFANLPGAINHINAGLVRPLVVSSSERSSALPDVPTAAEAGITEFEVDAWYALFGPAGMREDLVNTIADTIQDGVKREEVVHIIRSHGAEPVDISASEFSVYLSAEQDKWAEAVEKVGIQAM